MSTSQEEVFEEVLPEPAAGGSSPAPPSPAKPGPSGLAKSTGPSKKLSDSPKTNDADTYYVIRPEGYNGEQSFSVKQCCGNELKIVIKPEHYSEVEVLANNKQKELDAVNKKCTTLSKEKQAIKEKLKISGNQICDAKERLREIKIQLLFKLARIATWQRKKEVEAEIRPNNTEPKEHYLTQEKKLRDMEKKYREQSEKVMGFRDNIRSTLEEHVFLDSHAEDLKIENRRVRDQARNNQVVLESLKQQNAELETKCKLYWEKHSEAQAQIDELDAEAEAIARENDEIVAQNEKMALLAQAEAEKIAREEKIAELAKETVSSASKKIAKKGAAVPAISAGPPPKGPSAPKSPRAVKTPKSLKAPAITPRGLKKKTPPAPKKSGPPTPLTSNLRRSGGMKKPGPGKGNPSDKAPTKPSRQKGPGAGKKSGGAPKASAARTEARKVSVVEAAASKPTAAEIRAERERQEFEYEEKMLAAQQAEEESNREFAEIEYEAKMSAIREAGARAQAALKKGGAAPVSRTKSDLMRRLQILKEKQNGKVFTKEETDHINKMDKLREAAAQARATKNGAAPHVESKTKSDLMKRLQAIKDKRNQQN